MDDRVAIQQLLNRYSVSSSRRDFDDVVSTYAADGVWEIASWRKSCEGQAAIRDGLRTLTAETEYVIQQNSPGVIIVKRDTATATSVIRENGKQSRSDEAFEALGYYVDILVRTADGWRFKQRRFELSSMRTYQFSGQ
jgi:ketosteroid isomerase-like protein